MPEMKRIATEHIPSCTVLGALGLPFVAGDTAVLAEICKNPRGHLAGKKFDITQEIDTEKEDFKFGCAKRTVNEWPHKDVDLADKATIQTSILYSLVVILALITAIVGVHWYIRDKREKERIREMIDYHLIAMRRARYLKARTKREASFQRRTGIREAKEERVRQKKKRENEERRKREDEERRKRAKEERRSKGRR